MTTVNEKLNFVFKSGRQTLDMQCAKKRDLHTLRDWLSDIESAFSNGFKGLSNTDCALISSVFYKIQLALFYEHNIVAPYCSVYRKPENRVEWLHKKLKEITGSC